jgi:methylenetetrahydrofolate reductase (NADPH)
MSGRHTRAFSFEFFPPKNEQGAAKLTEASRALASLKPHYVSVTFGAGGSTREGTYQTVRELQQTTGLEVVPHLSCVGVRREEIRPLLDSYRALGVRRIVALRGDLPKDPPNAASVPPKGSLRYANELVAYIQELGGFSVTVGCYPEFHPEAKDPATDMKNFVRKVRAGADEAITQYFFNNDAYYAFVDGVRRLGVDVPIIPGLMPITEYKQIARFSGFCGAEIPLWIRKRMEALADDPPSQKALGIEIATRQAEDLLRRGAPGLHFYTLNRSEATVRIWKNLGLSGAASQGFAAAAGAL